MKNNKTLFIKVIQTMICCFLIMIGSGCQKQRDSVISDFLSENIYEMEYAFTYFAEDKPRIDGKLSDFFQIEEPGKEGEFRDIFYERQDMAVEAMNLIKDAVKDTQLKEITDLDSSVVLFIYRWNDEMVQLYDNGRIVTITPERDSKIYDSTDQLRDSADRIKELLKEKSTLGWIS